MAPTQQQLDTLRSVGKRVPSRERIEDLRRIAVFLGSDTEEGELLEEVVDLLLDLRVAIRGGRKEVRGSRHWDAMDEND